MTIYLDHCATTPLAPEVAEAMARAQAESFGNPSSVHGSGRQARALLDGARARVAACIHAPAGSLVLTGSGSESNNLALKGVVLARAPKPAHLVVSAMEHDCILMAARHLAQRLEWVTLTEVRPDEAGRIDPAAVERAMRPETCLVSVMQANNETGMLQPVREIAAVAHRQGALFHTDAVQGMGRTGVDVEALGCDLLSLAAHKFYGPKGVGLLYVRPGVKLDALVHGGSQEGWRRAGTENPAGAVGLAVAAELAVGRLEETAAHLRRLEELFWREVCSAETHVEQNGDFSDKVPGVINLAVEGIRQDDLVVGMDLAGIAISAGSACSSGVIEPSHVLTAMGLPEWRVQGGVRISFGRENTVEEALEAARQFVALCRRLASGPSPEGVRE